MKVCIILGSSNLTGHTYSLIKQTFTSFEVIHLVEKNISYFDYQNNYINDDFMDCLQEALEADLIVFASPVYWYCISAQLKVFLDRMTDLLYFDKKTLIELRKKKFAYMSVYSSDAGYALDIMKNTCVYLKLDLVGTLVLKADRIETKEIEDFYHKCLDAIKTNEEEVIPNTETQTDTQTNTISENKNEVEQNIENTPSKENQTQSIPTECQNNHPKETNKVTSVKVETTTEDNKTIKLQNLFQNKTNIN